MSAKWGQQYWKESIFQIAGKAESCLDFRQTNQVLRMSQSGHSATFAVKSEMSEK